MIHKPQSKSKMRDAAFKKEILRLQRKIYEQEAEIVRLQSELELRPSYDARKPAFRGSAASFRRRLRAAARSDHNDAA